MQTLVYQTEVRQAIEEQGVKPESPQRIYKLTLKADSNEDFETLAEVLEWLKNKCRREGYAIIEEEGANLDSKARAAKNN